MPGSKFDGKIAIELEIDAASGKAVISKINTELGKTDKQLKNINKRSKKFFTHFKLSLIVLNQAAELFRKIAQLAQVIARPIKEAGDFEQYRIVLKNLIGDIDEADARFRQMVQFAAKTPFNVPGIIEAGNRLQALGKYSIETITNLGDLAAASGKDVKQAIEAYTSLVTGRTGIAIKQFRAMLISTRDWERQIGKSVLKTGAGVKASINDMLEALPKIIKEKNFTGLMDQQSRTLVGMLSNLEDNFQQVMAAIGETFLASTKGTVEGLTKVLDWVKVNVYAIMGGLKEFGNVLKWIGGAAVAGLLIKMLIRIVTNINAVKLSFFTASWSAKTFTKNLKDMYSVSGVTMGGILGIISVIALLVTAMSVYGKSVNKSVGDLIAYNDQILSTKLAQLEEIKITEENAESKAKLLDEYVKLLKGMDKTTRGSKEFLAVQKKIKNIMPHLIKNAADLSEGTSDLSEDTEELNIEITALNNAVTKSSGEFGELELSIKGVGDELRRLNGEKLFEEFVKELTEGGGLMEGIGKILGGAWDQVKPEMDKVDDTADEMARSFFSSLAESFADTENFEELNKVWANIRKKLLSKEGLTTLKMPDVEDFKDAGGVTNIKEYKRALEVWGEAIEEGTYTFTNATLKGQKLFSDTWNVYQQNYSILLKKEDDSRRLVSESMADGLADIQTKMGYSADANKEVILKYKAMIDNYIKLVGDLDKKKLDKEGKLKIGEELFAILPDRSTFKGTNKEFDALIIQRRNFIMGLLKAENKNIEDIMETQETGAKEVIDKALKERRKLLKEWIDKRKILDGEFSAKVSNIELDTTITEVDKSKKIIDAKKKYQDDLLQLEKDFNSEYKISLEDRNGAERKYSADILAKRFKQTKETIDLYRRMYSSLQLMRDVDKVSVADYIDDIDVEMEKLKKLIVSYAGEDAKGLTFEQLSSEQLQRVAPALLEFLVSVQDEASQATVDLGELFSQEYTAEFLSSLEDLDNTSLDNLIEQLNSTRKALLLSKSSVYDLQNAIKKTAVDGLDLEFGDISNITSIETKVENLAGALENVNLQRLASIEAIKDEDQRSVARYAAEEINLKRLKELYKNAADALSGTDFNEQEKNVRDYGAGYDDAVKLRDARLQLMQDYKNEYLNIEIAINASDVSRSKFTIDLDAKTWKERLQYATQFVGQMQTISNSLMQMARESADAYVKVWSDAQFARLDKEKKQSKLYARTRQQEARIDEVYAANKEAIEKEADKKKYEKLKGWFELQKALSIIQVGINTAVAFTTNEKLFGTPLALIMNILTIAAAAAQIALISSKSMPGFKKGGYTGDGTEDDEAGTVHKKEFVVNARATKPNRSVLESMQKGTEYQEVSTANMVKPSLVGRNSVIDIRKDMQLSKTFIDSNGNVIKELKEFKKMMQKYLDNPVPSKAYFDDREAKKIVSTGIGKLKKGSL